MPCFEGLFPRTHDKIIQDLLFTFATWHAYAKLRVHTDSTLLSFELQTRFIGQMLRKFVKVVCPSYTTKQLPREQRAKIRRAASKQAKSKSNAPPVVTPPAIKQFNSSTYKTHALGDYPASIRLFGTIGSYSTRLVRSFAILTSPYITAFRERQSTNE